MAKRRSFKARFKKFRGMVAKSLNTQTRAAGSVLNELQSALFDYVDSYFEGAPGTSKKARSPGLSRRDRMLKADFQIRRDNGSIAPPKPYSKLTQNLGKELLKYGSELPPAIRTAAIDAVNGGGAWANERELQDKLRSATGITRGGASWMNKRVGQIRQTFRSAAGAAVMYDVASRGGVQGGMAQSELLQFGADKINDLTHNKFVKNVSVSVAKYFSRSPTEALTFLRALGRGVSLGGAIGGAAMMAVGVAQEYFESQRRTAAARIRQLDDARAMGVDVGMSRKLRNQTKATSATGLGGWARETFGFTGDIEEERADRLNAKFKVLNDARIVAGRLGVDVSGLLQARADKIGIGVEDLTQEEVAETLQPELEKAARKRVSGNAVNAELEKRLAPRAEKDLKEQLGYAQYIPHVQMSVVWGAKLLDLVTAMTTTKATVDAETEKIVTEFSQQHLNALKEETARAAEVASRAKRDQARTTAATIRTYKMNTDSWARRRQPSFAD